MKKIYFFIFIVFTFILSSCNRERETYFPGYVEGRYTYISVNYPGILQKLNVIKGDQVKLGDLLFIVTTQPESDDLSMATNKLQESKALEEMAKTDYELQEILLQRRLKLEKTRFLSEEELDTIISKRGQAYSNWISKKEDVGSQEANLRKTQWIVNQKVVHAPVPGLVFDTYFREGELVEIGVPVVSLLKQSEIRVYFFVPETILHQIKLQQMVNVSCDSCEKPIQAEIVYISPEAEYTPPVIYSNDVRSKLVYRIEAIPKIENVYRDLHPGQPITVTLSNESRK